MDSSFTPTEQILDIYTKTADNFPHQEILLTRLCMHVHGKLLDYRNRNFKANGINETLFMALIILNTQENGTIQPSELSLALGSSRTNATRVADELEQRGWIERKESSNDRRCLYLQLTPLGKEFLNTLLPQQHKSLVDIWSVLSTEEKIQLEALNRKVVKRLDEIDANQKLVNK